MAVRAWLARVGARTIYIEPDSQWENGYVESFNGKLGDELLDRKNFYPLREAQGQPRSTSRTCYEAALGVGDCLYPATPILALVLILALTS